MYTIKCDGYLILDVRDDGLMVQNPKVKVEVNTVGEGSFSIYNTHPFFDKLKPMKSIFEVSDEIGVIFRGRMTENTRDFYNGKAIDLEGVMAFFNDSMVSGFKFPEDFLNAPDYVTAAESGNVVEFLLDWFIKNHNSQVQDFQKFKTGNVTVADPNNYIIRESSEIQSTWDAIKSKLFDSSLGGYLCIRYEADGNYIDYLSSFTLTNTQDIEFGANLLDLKHLSDASTTYSAIIPIGGEVDVVASDPPTETPTDETTDGAEESEPTPEPQTEKVKLTLASIPDGLVSDGVYKITLDNGINALYSQQAVTDYGWICAPISETTWEDVKEVQNLLTKGKTWLLTQGRMLSDTVEVTAADLHFTDKEIQSFRIYRKINVNALPQGIEATYNLTMLDIDLLNPQNTKITVGEIKPTLTEQTNKDQLDSITRLETAEKVLTDSLKDVENVKQVIEDQSTFIVNTAESIIFEALKQYTEIDNFESFKSTIEAQLKILADEITLKFTQSVTEIENVNNDLQEKFGTITKYFTFDIDGLIIGQLDNPYKVIIDNDRYSMTVNGIEVLWFDGNGKGYIPELTVTRILNLLGYMIDQDAAGNVNCEYVGG